jgi:hypothetical protein
MNLTASVRVTTPIGYGLDFRLRFSELRAIAKINGTGYFELTIPYALYPKGFFEVDRRVEVEVKAPGREASIAFIGFMRMKKSVFDEGFWIEDYRDEVNYVYVGGKGQDTGRTVREVSDADRIKRSPINRREAFEQYSSQSDTDILDSHGKMKLREGQPEKELDRKLGSLSARPFGVDWELGDTITVASERPSKIIIGGPSWEDIFDRRIIAYKATTSEAEKTGNSDSLALEYVDEQLVNATDTDRNLISGFGFELGADPASGPSIKHAAEFGKLSSVLKALAEKSEKEGTIMRYGLTPIWDGRRYTPRFDVRLNRWGQRRTWVLGNGPENDDAEITAIEINVDSNGKTQVKARTDTTSYV